MCISGLGDTANVASRLERLTRDLGSPIIVSAELMERARQEESVSDTLLRRLGEDRATMVRGRTKPVSVWRLIDERGP